MFSESFFKKKWEEKYQSDIVRIWLCEENDPGKEFAQFWYLKVFGDQFFSKNRANQDWSRRTKNRFFTSGHF